MGSNYDQSIPLDQQVKNLKYRWDVATKKYIAHYPDFKLNLDKTQYNRAWAQVMNVFNDINILKANLDGNISSNDTTLKEKDTKIKNIKRQFNSQYSELRSKLGENKSSKPFKIQKYDENSKSYIFTTFYTASIFTLFYFLYKQINME